MSRNKDRVEDHAAMMAQVRANMDKLPPEQRQQYKRAAYVQLYSSDPRPLTSRSDAGAQCLKNKVPRSYWNKVKKGLVNPYA